MSVAPVNFQARESIEQVEEGNDLAPKFDERGLISTKVQPAAWCRKCESCWSMTTRIASGCESTLLAEPVATWVIEAVSTGVYRWQRRSRINNPVAILIWNGPIPRRSSTPRKFTATRRTRRSSSLSE